MNVTSSQPAEAPERPTFHQDRTEAGPDIYAAGPTELSSSVLSGGGIPVTTGCSGHQPEVKSALSRLVTSIAVHEDPRPGRKRPGAKLVVRGNLEALLTLTGEVTAGGSPGGTSALLTFQLPPRCIHLNAGRHGRGLLGD